MRYRPLLIVLIVVSTGCEEKKKKMSAAEEARIMRELQSIERSANAANKDANDFLYGRGNTKPVDVRVVP